MAGNKSLRKANKAKQDEFFTQLTDIEKELRYYKEHFKDKVVFCNCDDPEYSNFWKYFQNNFYFLGLKKLVSTHYNLDGTPSYKMEIVRTDNGNQMGIPDYVKTPLKQNGDFRSQECIEILKEADIVITNPPFSLFRDYVAQLMEYGKKFLIIGNQNAITYKEVFYLLQQNKMWLGYNNGDMEFVVPDYYEPRATRYREENGIKYRSMGNTCWFTNLDTAKRHEDIILYQNYTPEEYPHYDNFNAIEVSKVDNIPVDFDGVMGVPITFMYKYNPEQFEIVGITKTWYGGASKIYPNQIQVNANGKQSIVSKLNDGATLKLATAPAGKTHYIVDGEYYIQLYARILIRKKR